jgi:hypothetical protein
VRTPNLVSTSTWSSYLPRTLNSWFLKTRLIIMSAESIPETPRTPVIKLEVRLLLCHVRQFHYDLDSYGKNLSLLQFARYGTLPFLSKTWSFVEIVIFFLNRDLCSWFDLERSSLFLSFVRGSMRNQVDRYLV